MTNTPSPHPQYVTIKGGPIRFTVEGNLSYGQTNQASTYGGIVTGATPTPTSSPQNVIQQLNENSATSTQSAGMNAEVSRRTATTVTDIRIPLTVANQGGSQVGTVAAFYSTPKYTIAYASEPITIFGQLPLGSTLRGFAFIYPTDFGDVTFFEGPAFGAQSEIIDLYGVRVRDVAGTTFYEMGFTTGDGPETGRSRTLTFGAAGSRGALSLIGEGAWQERSGGDGSPTGLGGQVQLAYGGQTNDAELTLRHLPDQFVAYGAGEIYGDNFIDGNVHRNFGESTFAFDASWERIGSSPTTSAITRQEDLLYSGPLFRQGGYSLNLTQNATYTPASDGNAASSLLSNLAAGQLEFGLGEFTASFLGQLSRSVQDPGAVQSSRSFGGILQRQFGKYNLTATTFTQRTTQDTADPETQTLLGAGVTRSFGKATISLTGSVTHTISDTSDAIQRLPLITVSRSLSPVISAQASLGYQTLTDRLNPQSNGHSRVFNFQLNAPFAFGNGFTTGRADPRLPATILGRVQLANQGNGPVAGFISSGPSSGGLSNVEVILDDKYLQRTDLTGDFQFGFVTPGQHQLRIEGATIPRGLTVDQPVATITVQGGQSTQVTFQVGNFGGIVGHVYGLDEDGRQVPLTNVSLRLDGGKYAQTDTTGTFGFGGLAPGSYTVDVIENTVPAYATFDPGSLEQKVQVRSGGYAKMTFSAKPLGSIGGSITYGTEMLPDLKGGVQNVYVVAEPGEHAAINTDDGSYIIDNLPEGDYTVSVDPETLPEGLGASPESMKVHVGPGGRPDAVNFSVGRFEKKVVFSFLGGNVGALAAIRLREHKLPPNGTTEVDVTAPETAKGVTITSFNNTHVALTYDKTRKEWVGDIAVPADAKEGDYPIDASVASGAAPPGVVLTVDPKMPLAILTYTPPHPIKGDSVHVRARFLVDAREGDKIQWEDGQTTVLGKPVSGRVFTFDLRISLRPLHGALLTKRGTLPIELL